MTNLLDVSLVKIVKDNKIFLVNNKTFICIEFNEQCKKNKGVVKQIRHINYKVYLNNNMNKFIQLVIGKVVKEVKAEYNNKDNVDIKITNISQTLYTPYYISTPSVVCSKNIPDNDYLNLLIYFYKLYGNEFLNNFNNETKEGFLLNYSSSINKLNFEYAVKKHTKIDLDMLISTFPLYYNIIAFYKENIKFMKKIKTTDTPTENNKKLEDIFNIIKTNLKDDMNIKVNNYLIRDISYTESIFNVKCLSILFSSGWQVFNDPKTITSIKAIPKEITLL